METRLLENSNCIEKALRSGLAYYGKMHLFKNLMEKLDNFKSADDAVNILRSNQLEASYFDTIAPGARFMVRNAHMIFVNFTKLKTVQNESDQPEEFIKKNVYDMLTEENLASLIILKNRNVVCMSNCTFYDAEPLLIASNELKNEEKTVEETPQQQFKNFINENTKRTSEIRKVLASYNLFTYEHLTFEETQEYFDILKDFVETYCSPCAQDNKLDFKDDDSKAEFIDSYKALVDDYRPKVVKAFHIDLFECFVDNLISSGNLNKYVFYNVPLNKIENALRDKTYVCCTIISNFKRKALIIKLDAFKLVFSSLTDDVINEMVLNHSLALIVVNEIYSIDLIKHDRIIFKHSSKVKGTPEILVSNDKNHFNTFELYMSISSSEQCTKDRYTVVDSFVYDEEQMNKLSCAVFETYEQLIFKIKGSCNLEYIKPYDYNKTIIYNRPAGTGKTFDVKRLLSNDFKYKSSVVYVNQYSLRNLHPDAIVVEYAKWTKAIIMADVVVIDEMFLMSYKTLCGLISTARFYGKTIILAGDSYQMICPGFSSDLIKIFDSYYDHNTINRRNHLNLKACRAYGFVNILNHVIDKFDFFTNTEPSEHPDEIVYENRHNTTTAVKYETPYVVCTRTLRPARNGKISVIDKNGVTFQVEDRNEKDFAALPEACDFSEITKYTIKSRQQMMYFRSHPYDTRTDPFIKSLDYGQFLALDNECFKDRLISKFQKLNNLKKTKAFVNSNVVSFRTMQGLEFADSRPLMHFKPMKPNDGNDEREAYVALTRISVNCSDEAEKLKRLSLCEYINNLVSVNNYAVFYRSMFVPIDTPPDHICDGRDQIIGMKKQFENDVIAWNQNNKIFKHKPLLFEQFNNYCQYVKPYFDIECTDHVLDVKKIFEFLESFNLGPFIITGYSKANEFVMNEKDRHIECGTVDKNTFHVVFYTVCIRYSNLSVCMTKLKADALKIFGNGFSSIIDLAPYNKTNQKLRSAISDKGDGPLNVRAIRLEDEEFVKTVCSYTVDCTMIDTLKIEPNSLNIASYYYDCQTVAVQRIIETRTKTKITNKKDTGKFAKTQNFKRELETWIVKNIDPNFAFNKAIYDHNDFMKIIIWPALRHFACMRVPGFEIMRKLRNGSGYEKIRITQYDIGHNKIHNEETYDDLLVESVDAKTVTEIVALKPEIPEPKPEEPKHEPKTEPLREVAIVHLEPLQAAPVDMTNTELETSNLYTEAIQRPKPKPKTVKNKGQLVSPANITTLEISTSNFKHELSPWLLEDKIIHHSFVVDTECYNNGWCICVRSVLTNNTTCFGKFYDEQGNETIINEPFITQKGDTKTASDLIKVLCETDIIRLVVFNAVYDCTMIAFMMHDTPVSKLKMISNRFIAGQPPIMPANVNRLYWNLINRCIDITKNSRSSKGLSLKQIGSAMGLRMDTQEQFDNIESLEFFENTVIPYCHNDTFITLHAFNAVQAQLESFEKLGKVIQYKGNILRESEKNMAIYGLTGKRLRKNERNVTRFHDLNPLKEPYDESKYFALLDWSEQLDKCQNLKACIDKDVLDIALSNAKDANVLSTKIVDYLNSFDQQTIKLERTGLLFSGGCHISLKRYMFDANSGKIMLESDYNSFYPSMILKCNLLGSLTQEFRAQVELRLQCKKTGDKATANVLKIPINAISGAMNEKTRVNYIQDNRAAHLMYIFCQLLIISMAVKVAKAGGFIVQINTDAVAYVINKNDKARIEEVVKSCELAPEYKDGLKINQGLTLETDEFKLWHQKDVNNYYAEKTNNEKIFKGCNVKTAICKGNGKIGDRLLSMKNYVNYCDINNIELFSEEFMKNIEFEHCCFTVDRRCVAPIGQEFIPKESQKQHRDVRLIAAPDEYCDVKFTKKQGEFVLMKRLDEIDQEKYPVDIVKAVYVATGNNKIF